MLNCEICLSYVFRVFDLDYLLQPQKITARLIGFLKKNWLQGVYECCRDVEYELFQGTGSDMNGSV